MNSEEIASSFESTGASFNASVNKDKSSISLRSLTDKKYLNPSIKTLLDILSDSNFPQKEINLQKDRTISSIIEDESDPSEISSNLLKPTPVISLSFFTLSSKSLLDIK